MFILLSALLALAITGCAGWYIYRNLGSNLTAISRAMSRLAQGEPNVSVPALQRRDELGSWRGPLTFSPAIWRRWSTPPGC
jgi:HAMP domain-containing protein